MSEGGICGHNKRVAATILVLNTGDVSRELEMLRRIVNVAGKDHTERPFGIIPIFKGIQQFVSRWASCYHDVLSSHTDYSFLKKNVPREPATKALPGIPSHLVIPTRNYMFIITSWYVFVNILMVFCNTRGIVNLVD